MEKDLNFLSDLPRENRDRTGGLGTYGNNIDMHFLRFSLFSYSEKSVVRAYVTGVC